jgi:transcriptional regulator GlxA family with amidase domain
MTSPFGRGWTIQEVGSGGLGTAIIANDSALAAGRRPPLSVGFILLPEFTLLAFSAFVDALRLGADEWDFGRRIHCSWTVMGPDVRPVRASCGVEMAPWERFCAPGDFDYVVVVGGLLRGHERINPAIYDYLRQAAAANVTLVGVCTGSFALARAGTMSGRRACVHWYHVGDFEREFPTVRAIADELFVVDRARITCAGGAGAADLAVHLIERHCGRERALKSLHHMMFDHQRDRRHPQPRDEEDTLPNPRNPLVRRAVLLIEQNLSRRFSVRDLASQLCISERHLERLFRQDLDATPLQVARFKRLHHARWLLLNTEWSLADIAAECGFDDVSHFVRSFRRTFGRPPGQLRRHTKSNEGTFLAPPLPQRAAIFACDQLSDISQSASGMPSAAPRKR